MLTLWTDDPKLARSADIAGIDRVGLDLETLGKRDRQRGLGTWISSHDMNRLPPVRESLSRAQLFARTNAFHDRTAEEVDRLLALGVEVLMLPMFSRAEEVERFTALVGGRATVVPLLETRAAAEQIASIVAIDGLEEIHIGINDLAIDLGARNRFEVLDSSVVSAVSARVREAGLRFGIGAIGRLRDNSLPIPSDLIYAQYARLGASAALIARAYAPAAIDAGELTREVEISRKRLTLWSTASAPQLKRAHRAFRAALARCENW